MYPRIIEAVNANTLPVTKQNTTNINTLFTLTELNWLTYLFAKNDSTPPMIKVYRKNSNATSLAI